MNFAISYSGGKDCAFSLYQMISGGNNPVALVTTVNIEQNRSWFHGIQRELLEDISCSLNIPLILCECTPDNYIQAFEDGLIKARKMGADACVFGDIDIDGHRQWNQERCENVDIDCILPLWKQNRESIVHKTIEVGFKARIKIIQSNKLDESFLDKDLSLSLLERIKKTGSDVCGENGEYHTFVCDGPIFAYPVTFETAGIVDLGTHKAIDIYRRK
jgi:uncharacterized protein (TIGR00290 family)